jgi:hypothetical protein
MKACNNIKSNVFLHYFWDKARARFSPISFLSWWRITATFWQLFLRFTASLPSSWVVEVLNDDDEEWRRGYNSGFYLMLNICCCWWWWRWWRTFLKTIWCTIFLMLNNDWLLCLEIIDRWLSRLADFGWCLCCDVDSAWWWWPRWMNPIGSYRIRPDLPTGHFFLASSSLT